MWVLWPQTLGTRMNLASYPTHSSQPPDQVPDLPAPLAKKTLSHPAADIGRALDLGGEGGVQSGIPEGARALKQDSFHLPQPEKHNLGGSWESVPPRPRLPAPQSSLAGVSCPKPAAARYLRRPAGGAVLQDSPQAQLRPRSSPLPGPAGQAGGEFGEQGKRFTPLREG